MAKSLVVKWNTQTLTRYVDLLKKEEENLKDYLDKLKATQEKVAENWKSPAGIDYFNRMGAEVTTLTNLLKELEKQTKALEDVNSKCYETCQEEIKRLANSVYASLL